MVTAINERAEARDPGTCAVSVLVADESTLFREVLALWCESVAGFKVVAQCGDGDSALQAAVKFRPALMLVDVNLPRLHPLEILRKVRMAGVAARTILLSSRNDRKTVMEALRAGVSAVVLKSGPAANLSKAMCQVLAGGVYLSPEIEFEQICGGSKKASDDPFEGLSSREHQVFTLLIQGMRAKEIAARLDLSPKTVDTYRASLMRKLDIYDVAGLVKFAINRNLTSAE
jgi:DNA-binding NarL/FixJ family response regulator